MTENPPAENGNYPPVSMQSAGNEIKRLHEGIAAKLRSTLDDAIRIGEILSQVRERIPAGDFVAWILSECSFSKSRAYRYIQLFEYRCKIPTLGNLQEAYEAIKQITSDEEKAAERKALDRVVTYEETGEKPEGWRRGTDDKIAAERAEEREKVQRVSDTIDGESLEDEPTTDFEEMRISSEERKPQTADAFRILREFIEHVEAGTLENSAKRIEFKKRIKLSQDGQSDLFVDALIDYLDELEDDNRRIELCNNIVKVCRNYSVELQRRES